MTPRILTASLLASLLSAPPVLALSQDDLLAADLRPGWRTETGGHMAALDLRLAPGWKTYWRAPGTTGIPPEFDWSGSENLAAVNIHWPRPHVFVFNGLQSIGYHDTLTLPFEVTPLDPALPVTLRLQVDLGICKDVCLPASVTLDTVLSGEGAADPVIAAALSDRPIPADQAGLAGIGCTVDPISDGLRLTATMDLPAQGDSETVVFETATSGVWVSEASSDRSGNRLVASSDMVPPDAAPFALDRSGVTVTVIGPDRAVEITGCPAP